MLAPHVREQLECLEIRGIDADHQQVHTATLHATDRDPIVLGLLNLIRQRPEH